MLQVSLSYAKNMCLRDKYIFTCCLFVLLFVGWTECCLGNASRFGASGWAFWYEPGEQFLPLATVPSLGGRSQYRKFLRRHDGVHVIFVYLTFPLFVRLHSWPWWRWCDPPSHTELVMEHKIGKHLWCVFYSFFLHCTIELLFDLWTCCV